jgi:hypothetical protein
VKTGYIQVSRDKQTTALGKAAAMVVPAPYHFYPEKCPEPSLRAWFTLSGITEALVWCEIDYHRSICTSRLHVDSVTRIVKHACAIAGLDPTRYSGYSMRFSTVTSRAVAGAPERVIMQQGRWSSRTMLENYLCNGIIWQECTAAYVDQ